MKIQQNTNYDFKELNILVYHQQTVFKTLLDHTYIYTSISLRGDSIKWSGRANSSPSLYINILMLKCGHRVTPKWQFRPYLTKHWEGETLNTSAASPRSLKNSIWSCPYTSKLVRQKTVILLSLYQWLSSNRWKRQPLCYLNASE